MSAKSHSATVPFCSCIYARVVDQLVFEEKADSAPGTWAASVRLVQNRTHYTVAAIYSKQHFTGIDAITTKRLSHIPLRLEHTQAALLAVCGHLENRTLFALTCL